MTMLSPKLKAVALSGFETWQLLTKPRRQADGTMRPLMALPGPPVLTAAELEEAEEEKQRHLKYLAGRRAANMARGLTASGKVKKVRMRYSYLAGLTIEQKAERTRAMKVAWMQKKRAGKGL